MNQLTNPYNYRNMSLTVALLIKRLRGIRQWKFFKGIFSRTIFIILIATILDLPGQSIAYETRGGEELFNQYCSGCHINGGNIIRRGKTLKLNALQKRGLDDPEKIAEIAKLGIGSMSGYSEFLREGEEKALGDWVLKKAQMAWTQG